MLYSLLWAVVPPLLLLAYYYRRVVAAMPLLQLLLCFGFGGVSGLAALGLELGFEHIASWLGDWERITRSLTGLALRQMVEVGAIEEGCKLGGVLLFCHLSGNRRDSLVRSRPTTIFPTTIFMLTIAIALGFTAEENWVYLANGTASVSDRLIGTPVHVMFSAPWGYALAVGCWRNLDFAFAQQGSRGAGEQRRSQPLASHLLPFIRTLINKRLIFSAWFNAVVCHALVNIFSSAWRYSPPLSFLSYCLFPFLLWMFWRLEGLLRRVQRHPPIILISGLTSIHRYWQLGLVLFALMLGGNALFGFFLLARSLSPLSPSQLFYPDVLWFIVSRCILNLLPGLLAWGIYRYLRHAASRRYL